MGVGVTIATTIVGTSRLIEFATGRTEPEESDEDEEPI